LNEHTFLDFIVGFDTCFLLNWSGFGFHRGWWFIRSGAIRINRWRWGWRSFGIGSILGEGLSAEGEDDREGQADHQTVKGIGHKSFS
jgi:hypothetical protein